MISFWPFVFQYIFLVNPISQSYKIIALTVVILEAVTRNCFSEAVVGSPHRIQDYRKRIGGSSRAPSNKNKSANVDL